MKKINKYIISIVWLSQQLVFAQTANQVRERIEGTDRPVVPALATGESPSSSKNGNTTDGAVSDTGAQRPVQLKDKGVSSFMGYNTKYFFRSNPLSSSGPLKQSATGMWTNTFFAGAGLGVFDADQAIITPYIGISYTINDYIKSDLSSFNYNSTGAYALLLAQFGNGWSVRGGVSYSMDRSTRLDTEDYMEIYPNVGVLKSYAVNESTTAIFDASIGSHQANTDTLPIAESHEEELSSIEYSASYSLNYELMNFIIIPKYKISYKDYDEGVNKNRDDLIHDINFKVEYPLSDSLKISTFYDYSTRKTNGLEDHDFKSYDYGIIIGLNARF